MPTETVTCLQCAKPLTAGVRFCPFCAAAQDGFRADAQAPPAGAPAGASPAPTYHADTPHLRYSSSDGPRAGGTLLLRATEGVWHADDPEPPLAAGQPRPLAVVDEQVTHLAHTDRVLRPQDLLARAEAALQAKGVPVAVSLQPVAWTSRPDDARPRLVASLHNHVYSDLKLLFGVDYLGRWASLQLQVAVQPPARPASRADLLFGLALFAGAISLLTLLYGAGVVFSPFSPNRDQGVASLVIGALTGVAGLALVQTARRTAREEARERLRKQRQWVARTFAVDDMRLFCSAMQEVFKKIVDDIVRQGGEVVRVEGGQGGFFQAQGVAQAAAPARRSDAAEAGV